MRLLLFLISFLMLVSDVEAQKKKTKNSNEKLTENELALIGQQRLSEMKGLEASSSGNIIKFTPKMYQELVLKNPRPYDVVVLFTVDQQKCDVCDLMRPDFDQAVYSFMQERNVNRDFTSEKPVFFGIMHFASADRDVQEVFKSHGIITVPYLTVSAMNLKRDSAVENFFADEEKWHIGANEVYDAQKQIDFINNHLRTDVQIKFTFYSIAIKNLVAAVVLSFLMYFIKSIYPFLMNQWVWFGVAITVFLICTGGLVYSALNNMPWFRFERNEFGSVFVSEYFMRGQRGQYAGEGYIVSFLTTFIGMCYLFLSRMDRWGFHSDKSQFRLAVMVTLVIIWMSEQCLLIFYKIKSPWYNPTFLPPNYYQKGTLAEDQGNVITDVRY